MCLKLGMRRHGSIMNEVLFRLDKSNIHVRLYFNLTAALVLALNESCKQRLYDSSGLQRLPEAPQLYHSERRL